MKFPDLNLMPIHSENIRAGESRTWHRLAVAIEDAGFEVRDSIAWLYGSGFPSLTTAPYRTSWKRFQ